MNNGHSQIKYAEHRLHGVKHCNDKLPGANFSHRNGKNGAPPEENGSLANSDFRGSAIIGGCFDESDLRLSDFTGANLTNCTFRNACLYKATMKQTVLNGCDFEGADVRGLTITLSCDTFEGVKLSGLQIAQFLFFTSLAQVPEDVRLKLEAIIGSSLYERMYEARLMIQ